jgi:drug/metabolite transporter (DMT)-like permease
VFHVQPFWVVLIGAALFNERLGADRLGWIATAFVGLVLASGVATTENLQGHASYLFGVGEALAGSVLYATVTLIAKGLGQLRPHLLTLAQCLVGVVCLPFIAPLTSQHIAPMQWFWLVGMGVLHTGLAYVLIYGALPKLTTPVIAVLLFVYPLTAIVVDAVVYGRALSAPQLAGMMLIVVASLGVNLGWPLLSVLRRGRAPTD